MPSWETSDTSLDEPYHRNFVLKRPSTVGPWVALGLGVTLLAFLGSLVYLNLLLPASASVLPERVLRPERLFEKYQAASRLSIKRVIATYTNVSRVVGNSS